MQLTATPNTQLHATQTHNLQVNHERQLEIMFINFNCTVKNNIIYLIKHSKRHSAIRSGKNDRISYTHFISDTQFITKCFTPYQIIHIKNVPFNIKKYLI